MQYSDFNINYFNYYCNYLVIFSNRNFTCINLMVTYVLTGFTSTLKSSELLSIFCVQSTGHHLRGYPVLLVHGNLVLILLKALVALMQHSCRVVHRNGRSSWFLFSCFHRRKDCASCSVTVLAPFALWYHPSQSNRFYYGVIIVVYYTL